MNSYEILSCKIMFSCEIEISYSNVCFLTAWYLTFYLLTAAGGIAFTG